MGLRNGKSRKARETPTQTLWDSNGKVHWQPAVASLFSGIGGFDLGFQRAGFRVAFQCEINKFCTAILKKHWPNVPRKEDIKDIGSGRAIPFSDVWAGGFPCQDVSLARMGPRPGLRGKQSGLFHALAQLLEDYCPPVLLIENVPGLLSSHGGRDFQIVIRALAKFGYAVGWRVLNSKNFGVPQSRQRVFIVATYRDCTGPAEILFESQRSEGNSSPSGSNGEGVISPFKEGVGDFSKGPIVKKLAHCLYACSARHTGTDWSRNYASYPDGRVRRFLPVECERLQGFDDEWSMPPADSKFRKAEDLDSLRYYALGNAVTVPVAEWLARQVKEYLARRRFVDSVKEILSTEAP
jgi:DNA (cytosine-5)-methyltransferase 1